jgi:hypothetical protein
MIKKVIRGVIHGRTIELSEETGCAEGAVVEVESRAINDVDVRGENLAKTDTALTEAEWKEWEATMAEVVAQRKQIDNRRDVEFE